MYVRDSSLISVARQKIDQPTGVYPYGLYIVTDRICNTSNPISTVPAMAILRSSHKAGKTTPKGKPFKELLSRLGQRSQLAAPKYADSTKLVNCFV
jgi:hypothetical protein